ncbi:MAG: hypothetical protein ACI4RH_06425 [Huintestinicola sp.]
MKKQKKEKISITEILVAIYVVAVVIISFLPGVLGLYDVMVGKRGLGNTISAILIRSGSALSLSVPIFIIGIGNIRGLIKKRKEMKSSLFPIIGITFLTITIPVVLFCSINRTRYAEQQYFSYNDEGFGDLSILADCISDYFSDEYDEFVVNDIWLDNQRHISSSGRGGSSYHKEYFISGYNNKEKLFSAQIGNEDYNSFKKSLPKGFDITVTVYKKSRFIRSVEPSVDFGRDKSYEHFFEISVSGDKIVRSENLSAYEIDNLTWCEFYKGGSIQIENALCGINAENSLEYPYSMMGDEICLYAWVDGGYKRVSNIIYKEDISQ